MKKLVINYSKYPHLLGSSKSATKDILKMTSKLLEDSTLTETEILQIQNDYFGRLKDMFSLFRKKQEKLEKELEIIVRNLEKEKMNSIKQLQTKL